MFYTSNLNIDYLLDPIVKALGWSWLAELTIGSIVIRLIMAVLFAGMIGGERASKRHAAGLRTYILVCVGATIAMITNQFVSEFFGSGDGARLGAQVISGIGFLGAGTILVTSRSQIRGLTTAAGLWACACMGLSIGIGFYTLSIVGCVAIILALTLLPKVENFFLNRSSNYELHVELDSRPALKELINFLRAQELHIRAVEHNAAYAASGLSVYTITIEITKEAEKLIKNHIQVLHEIRALPYVNYVEEIH